MKKQGRLPLARDSGFWDFADTQGRLYGDTGVLTPYWTGTVSHYKPNADFENDAYPGKGSSGVSHSGGANGSLQT